MGGNKNSKISKLFIVLKVNDKLRNLLSFFSILEESGEIHSKSSRERKLNQEIHV